MKRKHVLILLTLLVLTTTLATSCSGISITIPTDTPPPPPPPIITDTPTADTSNLPTPTFTNTPSVITPDEEKDDQPQEDVPLSDKGPWVVYTTPAGLFTTNWDGRGLTKMYEFQVFTPYVAGSKIWAAPQGGRVAVLELITYDGNTLLYPNLKIIKVPSGEVEFEQFLVPEDWLPEGLEDTSSMQGFRRFETLDGFPVEQVFAAVGVWNEITWSHDGSMLAFNGAIYGNSADLYLYTTTDSSLTRLTDGPSQSVDPVFSPDDTYIVHGAVEYLNWGSSGGGYDYQNVWAAHSDGNGVEKIYNREIYGYEHIIGWLSDTEYLVVSNEGMCGNFDLRMADINDGIKYTLLEGHHRQAAFDPNSGKILFFVDDNLGGEICPTQVDSGVYLFDINTREKDEVSGIDPNLIDEVFWNATSGKFFIYSNNTGLFTVDPQGPLTQYQSPTNVSFSTVLVSPDGERWIFLSEIGNQMAFGDTTGHYSEYDVVAPHAPIWTGNSTLALFFGKENGKHVLFGSTPQGPRPLVIQTDVYPPGGLYPTLVMP